MKKLTYMLLLLVGVAVVASCNDDETYADQKKRERSAINQYIADSAVNVISESEFAAKGNTTDVSRNEFVLFESSGVYMQIVRKGAGQPLQDGETAIVLCRFSERNLLTDSLQLTNNVPYYASVTEQMTVTNTSGTFSGSFISGHSLMYSRYGSAAVPSGWLVPFTYINLGRLVNDDDETAKVRLIVPAEQGQRYASQNVYPCLYDITFQKGR